MLEESLTLWTDRQTEERQYARDSEGSLVASTRDRQHTGVSEEIGTSMERKPLLRLGGGSQQEPIARLSDFQAGGWERVSKQECVLPIANIHFDVNSVLGCEILTLACLLAGDTQTWSQ